MPRNIQRIKINIYIKRIVSQVGYLQGLYSACRASPVTAQRPSRGAFSHKKPPSARSLWPLFHIQFHFTIFPRGASKCQPSTSGEASNLVEIFLGTGRSSCLEILAFPFRILSFIFLQKLRIVLHKLCHSLSSTNDDSVISVWRSVRLRLSKE